MLSRQTLSFVHSLLALLAMIAFSSHAWAYDKAVEGPDVVLNKLFPKKSKVELDGKFGLLLNSSYQNTFLAGAGITYFWSEEWGFNLEGTMALNSDKNERKCVETFYNDPNYQVGPECGDASGYEQDSKKDANWGPAYVPIRQLKYILTGNFYWNPIYGKQIILLSATNYFDFYVVMGGGVAMSDFYPKSPTLRNGKQARGDFCTNDNLAAGTCTQAQKDANPGTTDESLIGDAGRPDPQSMTNVVGHFGVGQRFHFMKRFLISGSLEDYLLVGGGNGLENFLTLTGGFGVRF